MIQVKGRVVARALLLLAPLVSACGPSKNDVQAMKLELSSMTSLLDTDLEQVKQKGKASLEKARAKNDLDEFLQAVKSAWSDQIAGCETSLSKMDVLEAFMLLNDEYAKELGFGQVRRSVVGKRAQVQVLRSRTEPRLRGIRAKAS